MFIVKYQFLKSYMTDCLHQRGSIMQSQRKSGMIVKLALLQMVGTLAFSSVIYFCFDARQAVSALLGGLIASVTSFYMAGRLFTSKRECPPEEMLARFYASVVLKVVLTLAMVAICIIVMKVSFLPFIIAYFIAAGVVNWLFLLVPDD